MRRVRLGQPGRYWRACPSLPDRQLPPESARVQGRSRGGQHVRAAGEPPARHRHRDRRRGPASRGRGSGRRCECAPIARWPPATTPDILTIAPGSVASTGSVTIAALDDGERNTPALDKVLYVRGYRQAGVTSGLTTPWRELVIVDDETQDRSPSGWPAGGATRLPTGTRGHENPPRAIAPVPTLACGGPQRGSAPFRGRGRAGAPVPWPPAPVRGGPGSRGSRRCWRGSRGCSAPAPP